MRVRLVANRRWFVAVAVGGVFAVCGVVAAASIDPFRSGATVAVVATRFAVEPGDNAVAYDMGAVDQFVVAAMGQAAASVGGFSAPLRVGALGMVRITRAGVTVHAPPAGYLVPTVFIGMPRAALAGIMGADVSSVLTRDTVILNELGAEITGAIVGDVIAMSAKNGSVQEFTIVGIRPYSQIGSSELVMNTDAVARLGATFDTEVVAWGFSSRDAFDEAVRLSGLVGRHETKVSRSWDASSPDRTLSTLVVKSLIGEPWYRFNSDGSISMHPEWEAANLPPARVVLNPTIPIRARCHLQVAEAISAALADVVAAGLSAQIEVDNANLYGGCFNARFNRLSGQIGSLSRHAYAIALDTNTVSNCQGCIPAMHCGVVRIFRKHGFAWGGNFLRPDGMHFEWIGEPRHLIQYPSRYCPNLNAGLTVGSQAVPSGLGTLTEHLEAILAGQTD